MGGSAARGERVQGGNPVEFPGQKKQQRFRMRGIKKASAGVQERLRRNLDILLDDPHATLPEVTGPTKKGFFSRDRMKGALKEIEKVLRKRENRKWLQKRMTRQGGDGIAKAYAGSLMAAHEEEISTVSVFNDQLYGSASFVQRGKGTRLSMVGVQNHSNPKIRLLAWLEMAKGGYWFFSWSKGFVCTGVDPAPPVEWLAEALRGAPVAFTEPEGGGEGLWVSKGMDTDSVGSVGIDHLLLKFTNGIDIALALADLRSLKDSFVISAASTMVPTNNLGGLLQAEIHCAPEGFDGDIPDAASEAMGAVVDRWLGLNLEDGVLAADIHDAFATQLTEGYLIGRRYFPADAGAEFIEELQGGALEKEAVEALLDVLEDGVRVDASGEGHTLASSLVRLETGTANSLLTATWDEYGLDLLEVLFDITGDEAEQIQSKQARGRGFGNFLRRLDEQQSGVRKQRKFPWGDGVLPTPLDFADQLVRRGRIDGLGPTISMARKAGSDVDLAMGWAWLVVHGKGDGEAWHFESDTRDKGGDWAPPLERLWEAAEHLLGEDGETSGYIEAMEDLRRATGTIAELPEP